MHGAIHFTGPDARTFLQGQLTNDVGLLARDKPLLAAHCTPQGRVVAIMELIESDDGAIVARLPASMVELLIGKLRRYVLRAKVTMTDVSGAAASSNVQDDATNEQRLEAIAAGRPQVYPRTSEAFVAQMLNLDLLGGISFNKGCYTGQEIVARAHYRGKVKRRMQRLRTLEPNKLSPGDAGRLPDGRSFKVVEAAVLADGRCEFLAVAPLTGDASPIEDMSTDVTVAPTLAEVLPLPYSLQE